MKPKMKRIASEAKAKVMALKIFASR